MVSIRLRRSLTILVLAVVPLLAGCFNPFNPRVASQSGVSEPPPPPTSPVGVLRLFEWCWNHRDANLYREIFTADYVFVFALTDSAGNAYRNRVLTREEDLDIATNLFVRGSATEPPPVSIRLTFDPNLIALPDSRPGKDALYNKEIAAQTLLIIEQPDIQVNGITRFFVVRGDSALLPQELVQRGFKPDSTRWYIQQVQDETLGTIAERVGPTALRGLRPAEQTTYEPEDLTWGQLLSRYDDRRTRAARAGLWKH